MPGFRPGLFFPRRATVLTWILQWSLCNPQQKSADQHSLPASRYPMNVLEAINARQSIRAYQSRPVEPEKLEP